MKKFFRSLFPIIPQKFRQEMRYLMVFYWLLTVAFAFLYGWSIYSSVGLREPGRLIPFTILMGLQLFIHWLSPRLADDRFWTITYMVVQGVLAFSITCISKSVALSYGLYLPLIGEVTGFFRTTSYRLAAILAYLALSIANILFIGELNNFTQWLLTVIPLAFFVILYVWIYSREMDARQEAQKLAAELEAANKQLTESARQIKALTLTTERQRVARELHDTLAQGLAGLILQLEAADSHLAQQHPERAHEIIRQTMQRARVTLGDARRVINDLRTGPLTSNDLAGLLQTEVDHFHSAAGIPCTLQVDLPVTLPDILGEHVRRFIAEGLNNIARHAHARQAKVQITEAKNELVVIVSDDGCGFEPLAFEAKPGNHYGLVGMCERARSLNGYFTIESRPGAGTRLELRIPL